MPSMIINGALSVAERDKPRILSTVAERPGSVGTCETFKPGALPEVYLIHSFDWN